MYAMDNLDWKKKTLEGGSFHGTTAIITETKCGNDTAESQNTVLKVPRSSQYHRTLPDSPENEIPSCYVSSADRKTAKSLQNILPI